MITFLAEILDPSGTKLTNIETVLSLTAARSFNSVGSASLVIPDRYDRSIFTYNTRMRLWRRGHQGTASLFGDTLWFARRIVHDHSAAAYTIEFEDAFALLNSSIVAYSSKTPYADKTLEEFGLITPNDSLRIDNMMRAYVRENLSSLALDTTRDNPLIVVEEDRNLAPHGEKTAAWQRIGDVLSDLARMSAENGLELFYDFVTQTDGTFQFRVWDKVRGVDRGAGSFSVLTLSDQLNQLDDIQVVDDYTNLGTYVYVLGYDSGPSQIVVEQSNDEFIRSDPFGRVEFSVSTPDVDVESVLENTGQAALQGRRPRHTVSARVVDGSGILYGRDYAYGDRVMIHVGDRKYSCHVNAVRTTWAEGVEDLEVRLTGQEEDASSRIIEDGGVESNQAPFVFAGADQETGLPFVPPTPGDPVYWYGDMNAYVLWDGARVFRTWDLQAASPTWEFVDTGITGSIYDGQYMFVDAETVGMWLMTSDAIWFCADIMATTPLWNNVLAIATVQAAEATPEDGVSGFKTMFHYWSAPGHLCVATGPVAGDGDNTSYQHAYFWVTEDYGQNWTMVDVDDFLVTNSGFTRGYCYSSLYAMNIFRSAPGTIWCVRSAPIVGLGSATRVFYSNDLGYTWSLGASLTISSNNNLQPTSLLNPFPDATDPSYVVMGSIGVSNRPDLFVSTDEWATATALTSNGDPVGYGGLSNLWRVNKRTFDNNHVIAWFRHTATASMHLLQSEDGGATWSLLYDSGIDDGTIPNVGAGGSLGNVANCAAHNTPNGWPPDINQWVMVRGDGTLGDPVVQLTLDNFGSLLDKEGNLAAIIPGGWTDGPADGFALPKVAPNV